MFPTYHKKSFVAIHFICKCFTAVCTSCFFMLVSSAEPGNGKCSVNTHTHNRFTALLEYVRDYPGEQVPER